jgi:hypothetical protein
MTSLNQNDIANILAFIQAARENLHRIETAISPTEPEENDDLDPASPLNKTGQFLTKRGIEVCYRLFDRGDTRYAVSEAMKISYGAATHRFHAWEKLGGKDRERESLTEL